MHYASRIGQPNNPHRMIRMEIPRVDNGKAPDELFNANLLFWLPADSPFGNFQLKLHKLSERVDELNRKIKEAFSLWTQCRSNRMVLPGHFQRHVYAIEDCVYLMRRVADEIIALVHCLAVFEFSGQYPTGIDVDEIGDLMKAQRESSVGAVQVISIFEPHLPALATLNDIANAFKHSFINSDHTLMATEEPCIHALHLKHNRLPSGPQFYNVRLADSVLRFDRFYAEGMGWLRAYSERNRLPGAFGAVPRGTCV
jgi:hypothetical protein